MFKKILITIAVILTVPFIAKAEEITITDLPFTNQGYRTIIVPNYSGDVLMVCSPMGDSGNRYSLNSLYFNGDAFTKIESLEYGAYSRIFYLKNPDVGTYDLTTNNSSVHLYWQTGWPWPDVACFLLSGVDTDNPIEMMTTGQTSSGTIYYNNGVNENLLVAFGENWSSWSGWNSGVMPTPVQSSNSTILGNYGYVGNDVHQGIVSYNYINNINQQITYTNQLSDFSMALVEFKKKKPDFNGYITWLGVGATAFTKDLKQNQYFRYDFCNEWEKYYENTLTLYIDDEENSLYLTKYFEKIKDGNTNAGNCSGQIFLETKGINLTTETKTAKVHLLKDIDESIYIGGEFSYTITEGGWQTNGMSLYANMPEKSVIKETYPSTSTIEFTYNFSNISDISTSSYTIYLYNNDTRGKTEFSSTDFTNTTGTGNIEIINGSLGQKENLSLILERNSDNEMIIKSNSFIITFGTDMYDETNIGGTTDEEVGIKAWAKNFLLDIFNYLTSKFPFNIMVSLSKSWNDSGEIEIKSTILGIIDITDSNDDVYVYFPEEWGGGENEQLLVWGKTLFYENERAEEIMLGIKELSTYFMWFVFIIYIYAWCINLYEILNNI